MANSNGSEKRIVNTATDLIFYTNTGESGYPIYVTTDREVWIKARPRRRVRVDEYSVENRYDIPILATFYVKEVAETCEDVKHPLLDATVAVVKEVTKEEPAKVIKLMIVYEVYRGDMESLLGEAKAYAIKVVTKETPFSGLKYDGSKAWAIGYDWKKRMIAKCPQIAKYVYVEGDTGKRGRAFVWLNIKLPVATPEFEALFNKALSPSGPASAVAWVQNVDQAIQELEKLIEQKERELAELKAKLEELKRLKAVPGRVASIVAEVKP
jgi:hypothetical protein